ncbi:SUMF1/EgtB/PvdO family nonheme iron enzyme [Chloroflexota bacterium]
MLRGGSWFSSKGAVRAAARLWNYPDLVYDSSGFRCASSP